MLSFKAIYQKARDLLVSSLPYLAWAFLFLFFLEMHSLPLSFTDGVGSWVEYPAWMAPKVKIAVLAISCLLQAIVIIYRKSLSRKMLIINYLLVLLVAGELTLIFFRAPDFFDLAFGRVNYLIRK